MKRRIRILTCILLLAVLCGGCTEKQSPEPGRTREKPADRRIDVGQYGYTVKEVLSYFMEVALAAEYSRGNENNFIKKWLVPVSVRVTGTYDEDDLLLMRELFAQLNAVEGFPGISECPEDETPNCLIRFMPPGDYVYYSAQATGEIETAGYSLIYYTNGAITRAEIGIRDDLTRSNRNHVILEEIVQSLGIQNDSYSYPDSLFYQGYNEPQRPSDLDWLLVRLMYREEILPAMSAEDVRSVAPTLLRE